MWNQLDSIERRMGILELEPSGSWRLEGMADSSQCPSDETLALLPDRRASNGLRLTLTVHLDRCTHCRTVLAFTGQYEACPTPRTLRASREKA